MEKQNEFSAECLYAAVKQLRTSIEQKQRVPKSSIATQISSKEREGCGQGISCEENTSRFSEELSDQGSSSESSESAVSDISASVSLKM